ncbi:MAG TPA: chromate efflux transporter [Dongiaceae bacterium]|jgi:chromate transporter|nr:chromate efflux transporter [Dongiaceae bacterium]
MSDAHPSLAEATKLWFKIGCLGFGGPAGQIALMHRLVVDERKWVGEAQFLHALNFCMLLPGPEAQQLATYLGWLLHGVRGGLIAGILFVLPGFCVILALSAAYAQFGQLPWLMGVFFGLKCAVIALVAEALWRVAGRALKQPTHIVVAALAFLALFVFRVPFPVVILAAALIGLVMVLRSNGGHAAPVHVDEKILVQSANAPRPFRTIFVGVALWLGPIALLAGVLGSSQIFPQMGWFFAKMAVVTFGGAYAVLAYVAQQVVQGYGWLTTGNMIDGLALAETTPGPLILVLTFIGYYAAHQQPGALPPMLAGTLGAIFVTWVTFVPSFIWIFLGAPYVERLRQNRFLTAMLAMVTAAVVGVIANLALWFALHVLFRNVSEVSFGLATFAWPDWRSADLVAMGLSLIAALALLRWRINLVKVLLATGALGYLAHAAIG